jgi:phosphohistidine phosphatase
MSDEIKIYLMRHAHAVSDDENPARPLSAQGHDQVCAMADFLRVRGGLEVERVWHSPLTRARETAELMCERLEIAATCREMDGLLPYDDQRGIARRLSGFGYPLLVVGHEPHLGRLTSTLVCGNVDQEIVSFKKGAIACLERERTKSQTILWRIRWFITPALVGEGGAPEDEE